jgi:hypothetical protein
VGAGAADAIGRKWLVAVGRMGTALFFLSSYLARTMRQQFVQGSVALLRCTTTHPLHTRFTTIIGASISEPTMRPNPRFVLNVLSWGILMPGNIATQQANEASRGPYKVIECRSQSKCA